MPRIASLYPRSCVCGFTLTNKQQWYKHKRRCETTPANNIDNEDFLVNFKQDELIRLIRELKSEIIEIKRNQTNSNTLISHTNNNCYNNNYNINNNSSNININLHGKEDTSYVSQQMLEHCIRQGNAGVLKLVEEVLFNKEKPENHTMRIRSMRDYHKGIIEILGPSGWVPVLKHPAYGRVWKQMFMELNKMYGRWEWEGDDYLGQKLGKSEQSVSKFMQLGESLVTKKDEDIPKQYVKPIDCMMLQNFDRTTIINI